jgi:hypothetical protein
MHSACAQRSSGRTDEPQSAQINSSSLTFDFASALVLKCATSPRSSWRCFRNCFRPDVAGSASPLPLHLLQFLLRPLHEQSRPERLTSLLQLQEPRCSKPVQISLPVVASLAPVTVGSFLREGNEQLDHRAHCLNASMRTTRAPESSLRFRQFRFRKQ